MSENLFLGDANCPHTPEQTLQMRLRCNDDNGLTHETDLLMIEAADRIEQLERELIEAQKGHARYEYMRKLTPQSFNVLWAKNLHGYAPFDDLIDAAIQEVKA